MAHLTKFEKRLERLFLDRTYKLRSSLGLKKRGPAPKLTRKKIDGAIEELQSLASNILARGLAKAEFSKNVGNKRRKKIKGRGWKEQKSLFEKWYSDIFPNEKELVYVFWYKRKCIYVGRTGAGGSRPALHFSKKWCRITRIDIYPVKLKSQTPKIECIATHYFKPKENIYKPSKKKWTKKCPLCQINKNIDNELRTIFRIKKIRRK